MIDHLDNMAIILAKRPEGLPNPDDFQLENRPLGERPAGQVRCQTLYLSLDPYMRSVIAGNHMGHGVDPGDVIAGRSLPESWKVMTPTGRLERSCVATLAGKRSPINLLRACLGCPRP